MVLDRDAPRPPGLSNEQLSNGENFDKELPETRITKNRKTLRDLLPGMRFLIPTAKRWRSSLFGRKNLTQWSDIARLLDPCYRKEIQLQGLAEFSQDIEDAVSSRKEAQSDDDDDNLFAVLDKDRDLLGLNLLPNATTSQTALSTPIFVGHSDANEKKPYILGEAAARTTRAAGHWYKIPEEIDDIVGLIRGEVG
ncbi:acyl-protein thioesterase [Xylaria curta]|nr:acyl-protein thioesterase [Xylaria curta]